MQILGEVACTHLQGHHVISFQFLSQLDDRLLAFHDQLFEVLVTQLLSRPAFPCALPASFWKKMKLSYTKDYPHYYCLTQLGLNVHLLCGRLTAWFTSTTLFLSKINNKFKLQQQFTWEQRKISIICFENVLGAVWALRRQPSLPDYPFG